MSLVPWLVLPSKREGHPDKWTGTHSYLESDRKEIILLKNMGLPIFQYFQSMAGIRTTSRRWKCEGIWGAWWETNGGKHATRGLHNITDVMFGIAIRYLPQTPYRNRHWSSLFYVPEMCAPSPILAIPEMNGYQTPNITIPRWCMADHTCRTTASCTQHG